MGVDIDNWHDACCVYSTSVVSFSGEPNTGGFTALIPSWAGNSIEYCKSVEMQ